MTEVLLQVAVFAPGVYELSDYSIAWSFPALDNLNAARPGPPIVLVVESPSLS